MTDRDKAVRAAAAEVFPSSKKMLCAWHIIDKNLKDKCKKSFDNMKHFEDFVDLVWGIQSCKNEEMIDVHVAAIQKHCVLHSYEASKIMQYIESLLKEKECWIACFVDSFPHLNTYTTGRVESQHAALKKGLFTAVTFEKAFNVMHDALLGQRAHQQRMTANSKMQLLPFMTKDRHFDEVKYKVNID